MLRRLLLACLGFAAVVSAGRAGETDLGRYTTVAIAPTKTSIYIGSVSMTMPAFTRKGHVYTSTYVAKVFPYFYYNEEGTLAITVTDEMLRHLEQGQVVEFSGRGLSTNSEERRIEGKATPVDAVSGRIKVRVFVSKRIQLIFNTTYRFGP